MARKPAPRKAHEPEASPADQAFGAALTFVQHLTMVAERAREYRPSPDKPDVWQDVALNFADAFMAWYDLTHLLTPAVCSEARRVYPPGAASIKLGGGCGSAPVEPAMPASVANLLTAFRRVELDATPYPTVIEAVANGLGVYFRNAVYADRRHPLGASASTEVLIQHKAVLRGVLDGRISFNPHCIESYGAGMKRPVKTTADRDCVGSSLMQEWCALGKSRGESVLCLLRCDPINSFDLRIQLMREAEAVIAAASKPNAPTIDPAILARLEAAAVGLPAALEGNRAGIERVAGVIESLSARKDHDAPAAKLPELKAHDRQAWKLATLEGMTQDKVAAALNREHGTAYTQGQVSRMIARAKAHADANGLTKDAEGVRLQMRDERRLADRARTADPGRLELGARVDDRRPRPSNPD